MGSWTKAGQELDIQNLGGANTTTVTPDNVDDCIMNTILNDCIMNTILKNGIVLGELGRGQLGPEA